MNRLRCGALAVGIALLGTYGFASHAAERVASSFVPDGAPAESLTIEQCVVLSRQHAPDARAAALAYEAAQLDSGSLAHNRRPTLSVFGGTVFAPKGFYDPAATNLGEYELKVGLELPLKDGGVRSRDQLLGALSARNAAVEIARTSRDAAMRAAELALDALRAREQAMGLNTTMDWLTRLRSLVNSGVRAGAQNRADAERVEIELDAVRFDLEAQVQAQSTDARELSTLIGTAPMLPLLREPASDESESAALDSSEIRDHASQAPEVRMARIAEAYQQIGLEAARRRNSFVVDFAADAGIWGTDLTRSVPPDLAAEQPGAGFGDRLRRDMGASASLRFKRALVDPSSAHSVEARERDLSAARSRTAAALAERTRQLFDAQFRGRIATGRLVHADSSVSRAEEHLLRLRSLYAAGAASLLELLDARRQLDDARGRRAETRMARRLAHWQEVLQ